MGIQCDGNRCSSICALRMLALRNPQAQLRALTPGRALHPGDTESASSGHGIPAESCAPRPVKVPGPGGVTGSPRAVHTSDKPDCSWPQSSGAATSAGVFVAGRARALGRSEPVASRPSPPGSIPGTRPRVTRRLASSQAHHVSNGVDPWRMAKRVSSAALRRLSFSISYEWGTSTAWIETSSRGRMALELSPSATSCSTWR